MTRDKKRNREIVADEIDRELSRLCTRASENGLHTALNAIMKARAAVRKYMSEADRERSS